MIRDKQDSFKTNFRNLIRALSVIYHLDKRLFYMQILNGVSHQAKAYINMWIAALVINGVLAGEPVSPLLVYAVIAIVLNLAMNIISQYTAARRQIRKNMWPKMLIDFFHRKSERMDYPNFENMEIRTQWNRIEQQFAKGQGISSVVNYLSQISSAAVDILISTPIMFRFLLAVPTKSTGNILFFRNTSVLLIVFFVFSSAHSIYSVYRYKYLADKKSTWNRFYGTEDRRRKKIELFTYDNKRSSDRKIYGLKDVIIKEEVSVKEKTEKLARRLFVRDDLKFYIFGFLSDLFMDGLLYSILIFKVSDGAIAMGSVLLYALSAHKWTWSVKTLIQIIMGEMNAMKHVFRDQYSYLDMEQKMYHGTLSVEKRSDRNYQVEFRDVSFRYPSATDYAMHHVNFKFHVGERLAVVGMNGSGKTTFIKLMCRLYDPTEGTILLNGIDIKEYDYDEYMELFSVVFQDFKLFAYPLAENIAASKQYEPEKVKECLQDVGLSDRVAEMKNEINTSLYRNYDTDGVEISGGEAQKVALARALYKNAPFIILDEPTASLDPLAEADIYSRFNDIVGDKTAIYISHRLSSCRFCDVIAVFHEGEIIEVGTHEELVKDKNSKYYEMWNAQAQYYTDPVKAEA